jgi:hypothetical protein
LFEFLARFGNVEELRVVDESEERVLRDIPAESEKLMTDPFQVDYQELSHGAGARSRER